MKRAFSFSVFFLIAASAAQSMTLPLVIPEILKVPVAAKAIYEMLKDEPKIDSSSPHGIKHVGGSIW